MWSPWTAEEDAILVGMVEQACRDNIWAMAKEDGRLIARGNGGVKARVTTLVSLSTPPGITDE